jgi:M6 family metalloprotease-like protein
MKKSKTFRPIPLFVLLASCLGYSNAAPFPPEGLQTSWDLPTGEAVKLRVFGDEFYARTETEEGYTAIYNNTDSKYYYAALSADGSALIPSTTPLPAAAPVGLIKHLDLSSTKIEEISLKNRDLSDGERKKRWTKRVEAHQALQAANAAADPVAMKTAASRSNAAAVLGSKIGLTILVQFPDDSKTSALDPINFPTDSAKIERFCNGVGYTEDGNTGSVRDYFFDQSLGKMTYTQKVTNIVTVPHPRDYYNFKDYPTNKVVRPDAGEAGRLLLTDAITILKAGNFDFTPLTLDGDKHAIATNVFFAGRDSGIFAEGLWPHSSELIPNVNVGTSALPIYISNYQITNIDDSSPVIGTFCHENGHLLLGYPDIYAVRGQGVGRHCLMGSGNYLNDGKTPSPLNLYFKEVVGWATINNLSSNVSRAFSLPTTGNVGYRVGRPGTPTENFVVENRGTGDKWAQFSNDKGIIIWHIDETIDGNFYIQPGSHYGLAIVQADGKEDLEKGVNRGDSGDYFDLDTYPKFSNSTTPNSNWFDGSKSYLTVKMLTGVGASTDVQFGSLDSNSIAVTSPNGGETLYPVSSFPLTWDANIVGNVKIELYKNGVFDSLIVADTPNDGLYQWNIMKLAQFGRGFTIRISSVSNSVAAVDDSDSSFSITNAQFPDSNQLPTGWFKPAGAQSIWKVTKSTFIEGSRSLVSGETTDGKTSAIAYRSNFKAGPVTFYMKASSEQNYDFARFYIDGVAQIFKSANSKPGISGSVDWVYASFPIPAGNHTLKWTYEKDDSYAGLEDSAWLDGVALPQSTQEIAVFDPKGENIENGQHTALFPSTLSGDDSKPLTFTIKNTGKANLQKLKVSLKGLNAADFKVSSLASSVIAPGKKSSFTITFAPKGISFRKAIVVIRSDDEDENPFSIPVEGNGIGVPQIGVSLSDGTKLTDNGPEVSLGRAAVGATGTTKLFTILNTGNGDLERLVISASGLNKKDFSITSPGVRLLAPGETTTFRVTFAPSASGKRLAALKIASNDERSGPFDINLSAVATPKKPGKKSVATSLAETVLCSPFASLTASQTSSVEVIDGVKYLALTVAKPASGVLAGAVEVSPNLLDWYSGDQHTTVLIDDAATLKVRDNSPVTPEVKRYIRFN